MKIFVGETQITTNYTHDEQSCTFTCEKEVMENLVPLQTLNGQDCVIKFGNLEIQARAVAESLFDEEQEKRVYANGTEVLVISKYLELEFFPKEIKVVEELTK